MTTVPARGARGCLRLLIWEKWSAVQMPSTLLSTLPHNQLHELEKFIRVGHNQISIVINLFGI